jgi:hypothetical protein
MLLRGSDVINIGLKLCYWLRVVDLTQIISVCPACVYNMPVIVIPAMIYVPGDDNAVFY